MSDLEDFADQIDRHIKRSGVPYVGELDVEGVYSAFCYVYSKLYRLERPKADRVIINGTTLSGKVTSEMEQLRALGIIEVRQATETHDIGLSSTGQDFLMRTCVSESEAVIAAREYSNKVSSQQ